MTAECCESFLGTDVRGKTIPDIKDVEDSDGRRWIYNCVQPVNHFGCLEFTAATGCL